MSREYEIYFLESATKFRLFKMRVNLAQHRGAVGNVNNRKLVNAKAKSVAILFFNILLILKLPFLSILIMLGNDKEIDPGLKTIHQQGFPVCRWNLNSILRIILPK